MSNLVQLPYRKIGEPDVDYFDRKELWRQQRGWITRPIPPPPDSERAEIAERQIRDIPPLFAFALRRA